MTEVGNRKKKHKFLFHKNLTPGTLQRSIFFFLSFRGCSLFQVLVWMCLELQNSTQSDWKKNKAKMSQSSPRVSLLLLFSCPSWTLLSFSTLLCRVCVRSTAGGRWWSGWLQGEVALLSTVVLTSTETCQARSLGLGQGQTLQERWVLPRQKGKDVS